MWRCVVLKNKLLKQLLAVSVCSLPLVAQTALAADAGPTVQKDSVLVEAHTLNVYKKDYDKWAWVPRIVFNVNGPIPSGGQLYGEFSPPGAPSIKFDCDTRETAAGRTFSTDCGGSAIPEEKGTLYTGKVSFKIGMRNELAGTDITIYSGKATISKVHTNEVGPKAKLKFVYFVQQDWTLPIGYVYLKAGEVIGWKAPTFQAAFWVRGEATNIQPHLFHNGKEVGKMFFKGDEVGKASCESDVETEVTQSVEDTVPQKAKWQRVRCDFPSVRAWDKSGEKPGMFGEIYTMDKNPGDYELKVLIQNHLARSLKFKVGPDGKYVSAVATANKLGDDRAVFPVQILGDQQDGKWDKNAYKTDAYYGNPLTGFTALP
ncbi:MAG: hypothetical protein ABI488_00110 [Polyangiaceae bacterium]